MARCDAWRRGLWFFGCFLLAARLSALCLGRIDWGQSIYTSASGGSIGDNREAIRGRFVSLLVALGLAWGYIRVPCPI